MRRKSDRKLDRDLRKLRRWAEEHNVPPVLELTAREKEVHKKILQDPEAKHTFTPLVKRGFPDRQMLIWLVQEAWGPNVVAGGGRFDRGVFSSAENAAGAAKLNSLAGRLKRAALDFPQPKPDLEELSLREIALGHPKRARELEGLALVAPHPVYVLRRCAGSLRRAAVWVRNTRFLCLPKKRKVQTEFTLSFLETVRKTTSHYSFKQVAALMRVTHRVAKRGGRVSRDSLSKLVHRH